MKNYTARRLYRMAVQLSSQAESERWDRLVTTYETKAIDKRRELVEADVQIFFKFLQDATLHFFFLHAEI